MLNIYDVFHALQFAVLAYTISCVLIQQDYILERYGDFLTWLINKKLKWLAYPLGQCEKCLSGQLAFWIWGSFNYQDYFIDWWHTLVSHVLVIAFSIVFVIPLVKLLNDE